MSEDQKPTKREMKERTLRMMLAAQVHMGSKNVDSKMTPYVWKRSKDGVHIINLQKTWEKLHLAAKIIAAVPDPKNICIVSSRIYGQRAAMKFANYIGGQAIVGRFTPGTFTNQIEAKFQEPQLLILTDPRTDSQPRMEASYVNIPVIALCDTDSTLEYVDCAIPANNKGKLSVGLMYYLLTQEVLRLRGEIGQFDEMNIMVDMFFYREQDEQEKATSADWAAGENEDEKEEGEKWKEEPEWDAEGTGNWKDGKEASWGVSWEENTENVLGATSWGETVQPSETENW